MQTIHFDLLVTCKGVLKMSKKQPQDSTKLAGRLYDVTDYQKPDSLSQGLATTHEQASDTYMEGEIKPEINYDHDKNTDIPHKGN